MIGSTSVTLDPHAANDNVIPSRSAAAARDLLFTLAEGADPSVAALPRDDTITRLDGLPDSSAKWRLARPANAAACDRRTALHRATRAHREFRGVPCDRARASRRCRESDAARR